MKHKLKPIAEQTIVITGGSSGIGLATALAAAAKGAHVIVVARKEDALRTACDDIRAGGGRADYFVADVGIRSEVHAVVQQVIDRFGGFDTWVNNAGIGAYARLEELSDEDHQRLFQTNYWGVVYGSTEALPHLRAHGGALINIGSISSEMPSPILSSYTASKFAVKGFTDSLRLELIHDKAPVSVTLIQPSGIHTPFAEHAHNRMDHAVKVPPPVYAPEIVAEAICHAAEKPTRDLIVGGAGRVMTWLAHFAPNLSDRLFAAAFFQTARDTSRPPHRDGRGFHTAGSSGELYGKQDDNMRRSSIWTALNMRPASWWLAMASTTAIGVATAAWLLNRNAPSTQENITSG